MMDDDDNDECLPVPRRSLVDQHQITTNYLTSDNENSPFDRRQSRLLLNNSISNDSGVDEAIQTPTQLIALYEKTIELAAKNKINVKNAFDIPLVERLPEILDIIAFDDIDSSHHHEPNFVKAGSVIDTSAKIYGYRVDALHMDTQKLSGSVQQKEEDEEEPIVTDSDQIETAKKLTQRSKPKASSYLVTDLSTISLPYAFEFHPFQPSHMCQWPGGVGIDSLYADMISCTMYSSSDFPLINGFVNLNSRINKEYNDHETTLDIATKTMYDLIPLREVIKDNEGHDHILGKMKHFSLDLIRLYSKIGCQVLREFSFNEDLTESYIETIDECSIIDSSLISSNDDNGISNEIFSNGLSELRDDTSHFYFQELPSAHTFPATMVSMDMTLLHSKMSFVDHIPQLLREKTEPSDYSYFDATKLKLFAGPYLWKYTNLLPDLIKPVSLPEQHVSVVRTRMKSNSMHHFKFNLFNDTKTQSLNELMTLNSCNRKALKRGKRKRLSTIIPHTNKFPLRKKTHYQMRLSRRLRPLTDLFCLNHFPDYSLQILSNNYGKYSIDDDDDDNHYLHPSDHENPFPEQVEYDFIRPVHYEKIEFDKNLTKIDAKKLQIQLFNEYNSQNSQTSNPITLSTLCIKLIDQGFISYEKDQIASAFYCMLNNCNKNHLYMKNNLQRDDLIIQKQPFSDSLQISYSHSRI